MGLLTAAKTHQRHIKAEQILSGGSVLVGRENIYYEAAGVSEHGPTVLFLHESGGSAATWHGQLVGLAQVARCLVVDLPGHGRSEGAGHAAVSAYREAVAAFLDALAIRWPVVVAGVCLGAAIAVDLALHAPERVAGLVLAGVSEQGRAGERTTRKTAQGEVPEEFIRAMFSHGAPNRLVSRQLQRWCQTSPTVRYGDICATKTYPLRRNLLAIGHPVLLVAGEADPVAPPTLAQELAQALPQGQAVVIARAGCLSMVEQSGTFNLAVSAFLAGLASAWPRVPDVGRPGGYRRGEVLGRPGRKDCTVGGKSLPEVLSSMAKEVTFYTYPT